ncbi:hypothetical protein MNVI_06770 [Mycobacterium noviomagense]|uniref:Uncharacterized protein n=2 Tax=Mycobacterium noviomagense TaxID=459858 RepID=A0A7I7P9W1_9MYCO|nr:hypothetical protein MNVI_06770 [Mycobacterium noviomagense]
MKNVAHLPMAVTVAAGIALTGLAGTQIAVGWAGGWQATAYHTGRAMAGAMHNEGNNAGEPANYPGDGTDNYGTDSGGGGGAGG